MLLHSMTHLLSQRRTESRSARPVRPGLDAAGVRRRRRRSGRRLLDRAVATGPGASAVSTGFAMPCGCSVRRCPPALLLDVTYAHGPGALLRPLMDARCGQRGLAQHHSQRTPASAGNWRFSLLYVRAHWLRMPPGLLARHLLNQGVHACVRRDFVQGIPGRNRQWHTCPSAPSPFLCHTDPSSRGLLRGDCTSLQCLAFAYEQ